jgi:tellurite resistance protein TehA-like permease
MALGILAVGARDFDRPALSTSLMWFGALAFVGLGVAIAASAGRGPRKFSVQLGDVRHCFHAYTIVAALAVMGITVPGASAGPVGFAIWTAAVAAWGGTGLLVIVALRRDVSAWRQRASGSWLLLVVATHSLAILGSAVASSSGSTTLGTASLLSWLVGVLLYPLVAAVVIARWHGRPSRVRDFTPDHWIVMGALAITAVAALRIAAAPTSEYARTLLLVAATVAWGLATCLYAPLVALSAGRWCREPATRGYEISWWSMIFPLGMYAVATLEVGRAHALAALIVVAQCAFWVAVLGAAVVGMALLRSFCGRRAGLGDDQRDDCAVETRPAAPSIINRPQGLPGTNREGADT